MSLPLPEQSTARSGLTENSGSNDRIYWRSRQWAYGSLLPRNGVARVTPLAPQQALDHSSFPPAAPADPQVVALLANSRLLSANRFQFGQIQVSIRPTVWRLLRAWWSFQGKPLSIVTAAELTWDRPRAPSHATLRTTVFRVNAALELVKCPLRLVLRENALMTKLLQDKV